jgi:hypothetical protein
MGHIDLSIYDIDGLGEYELVLVSHTGQIVQVDSDSVAQFPLENKSLTIGMQPACFWDGINAPENSQYITAPILVFGRETNMAHAVFQKQWYDWHGIWFEMIYNPIVVPNPGQPWQLIPYTDAFGVPHLIVCGNGAYATDYGNYTAPPLGS